MSKQRWAVLGTGVGWFVVGPGDVCRRSDGRLGLRGAHSRHDTWTEAMQEADRQARMNAGMREEWRAEFQAAGGGWFIVPDGRNTEWGGKEWAEAAAKNWRNDGFRVRLVCRRIFELSEVADE